VESLQAVHLVQGRIFFCFGGCWCLSFPLVWELDSGPIDREFVEPFAHDQLSSQKRPNLCEYWQFYAYSIAITGLIVQGPVHTSQERRQSCIRAVVH
jgi:hypothetical protein